MSLEDDLNTWLAEPEFAAQYWKTRFDIERRERTKFQNWVDYLVLDPSQAKHNSEIRAYVNAGIRSEYESGRLIKLKKELYG